MELTKKCTFNISEQPEKEEEDWTKGRILKNLAVVCAGVFLYLSAALPSSELQSSLNFEDGLGSYSNSIGAAINLIPSALLPPYLIRKFGLKPCIVGAILVGTLSYFGNYYPAWYTLIPSAILSNMGTMPMWTAKGTYITYIAEKFAKLSDMSTQVVTNLFFGIFYSTYYCGYIFGNLLPYYILKRENETMENGICGFDFCDSTSSVNNTNFNRPPNSQVYMLFGIFAIISALGALVVFLFLDGLKVPDTNRATWHRLLDTLVICKRWDQLCMCTISFYRGINRALLTADFTKGYITCTWGMNHVGYVMLSFGLGCGLLSVTLGYLVRWVGRPVLFFFATTSNAAIMLTMIFWKPNPDEYIVFFVLVFIWGASNAVWESQVAALNPTLFPDQRDAAYTNYANSESVGTSIGLGISAPVCMKYKVYLNLIVLFSSAVAYGNLELGPLRKVDLMNKMSIHTENGNSKPNEDDQEMNRRKPERYSKPCNESNAKYQ